jgi:hypothetical protein
MILILKEKCSMAEDPDPNKIPYYPGRYIGMGLGGGLVFGAALGFFSHDMLMGVVVGVVGGLLIGWILDRRKRSQETDKET